MLAVCACHSHKIVYLIYKFNMENKNAIEIAIRELVDAGRLAGAATLAWRMARSSTPPPSGAVTSRMTVRSSATPSSVSRR